MMRLLADTNVVLDLVLARQPFAPASATLTGLAESGAVECMISAHALTTIHYVLRRQQSASATRQTLHSILRVFGIAAVDATVIQEALQMDGADFEDCVTAAAAHHAGCTMIVTRDPHGFRGSQVRAISPEGALAVLKRA